MLRFANRRIQSFIISVADKIEVMFLSYTLLHFQYVTQKTLKISDQPVCLFRPHPERITMSADGVLSVFTEIAPTVFFAMLEIVYFPTSLAAIMFDIELIYFKTIES